MSRCLALLLLVHCARSITINELYPFGDQDEKVPTADDISSPEIQLTVPIAFYETTYRSIFVNSNGILSFLTEVPIFFNAPFPLTYPIIAPLYSDVDTRGSGAVYYRETREPELLTRASSKVHRHFSQWQNFLAQSLFVVTWSNVGRYNSNAAQVRFSMFNHLLNFSFQKNTFQVVIASDGINSFVLFHYPDDGIEWIQGEGKIENMADARAQAGFMSGDGRLHALPGSGSDQIQRFDRMSNINDRGVWLFRIGNVGAEGNIVEPDIKFERLSGRTCQENPMPCPKSAECKQFDTGICCQCLPGYYGNGRECIPEGLKAQRMAGRVSGYLNNSELQNVDLHAYVDLREGRAFTALSRVPPNIGHRMQALVPIGNIIGWLFAKPISDIQNGFSLTGAVFNRTAELEFPETGDHIFIQEHYMGTDVFGNVKLTLEIRGSLPEIHLGSRVELDDYKVTYTSESRNRLRSHSERILKVDEGRRQIRVIIDQTITFDSCAALPPSKMMSNFGLRVSRSFITYDSGQEIVRFAGLYAVEPPPADDPCTKQRINCGEHSTCVPVGSSYKCICQRGYQEASVVHHPDAVNQCVDVDECATGLHNCHAESVCTNTPGKYRCDCKRGFMGDGIICERERSCAETRCNENAVCVEEIRGRPQCRCREGFDGDGYICKSVNEANTEIDCRHGFLCDVNADCLQTQSGTYGCYCRPGFIGTGRYCIGNVDSCDKANNCDTNAECVMHDETATYHCACKRGFVGDGHSCAIENVEQDCSRSKNCHPYAQCVFDANRGASVCMCLSGFQGDGYNCKQIDAEVDCKEADVCSPEAECVLNPDTNKGQCKCRPSFEGDGLICRPLDECNKHEDCKENLHCSYDRNANRYKCVCNPGYQQIDGKCIPDSGAACNIVNNCHREATCKFNLLTREYRCECREGFKGDGLSCETAVDTCNVVNNCHSHAECVYDPYGKTYVCQCRPGFRGDGKMCEPERSCLEDPQQCHTYADCIYDGNKRQYGCSCRPGYLGNGLDCLLLPKRDSEYLIFAQGMSLLQMPTTPTKTDMGKLLVMAKQIPVGLDVDCLGGYVYWSDVKEKALYKATYNGSITEKVIQAQNMSSPEGLAVDWIGRNIFWTDSGKDVIQVATLDGKYIKTIIKDDLVDPRGIVVHPSMGRIFWTDWNRASPKIESANMDGTDRTTFITGNLGLPNMLTIDYYNNELCWTDAGLKRIECANLYTGSRKVVYASAAYPFDITTTRTNLYWTDWDLKFIYKLDKRGGIAEPLDLPLGGNGKLYGIVTIPEQCPPVTSVCAINNGGCEYLCLPKGRSGRSCRCPDDINSDDLDECRE